MANTIEKNSYDRAILHLDTTDGAITLAELRSSTDEAALTGARIVEIFYQITAGGYVDIDRGGTQAMKLTAGSGAPLVGNINYRQAGVALRGSDTADIGVEINGSDTYVTIVVHKIH